METVLSDVSYVEKQEKKAAFGEILFIIHTLGIYVRL